MPLRIEIVAPFARLGYPRPEPIMLDTKGNLIWMEDRFGLVMNFQVQKHKSQDYLTFWAGIDSYLLVYSCPCQVYQTLTFL